MTVESVVHLGGCECVHLRGIVWLGCEYCTDLAEMFLAFEDHWFIGEVWDANPSGHTVDKCGWGPTEVAMVGVSSVGVRARFKG